MPLDTRIALGVQPLQLADPLAREGQVQNILAAQAQQRAAGTQQQHSQLQIDQMQRQLQQDEDYVAKMTRAIGENGGPSDIMQAFRIMATNRNPQISQHGITGLQSLKRLDDAKKAGIYGTPASEAAPAAAPVIPNAGPAPGALGSGTYGMDQNVPMFNQPNVPPLNLTKPTAAPAPAPVINQLTPPAAAPVNQLAAAPQANAAKALETEYMKLSQYSDLPGVKDRMALIAEQLKELRAPRVVAAGGSVYNAATNKFEQAPEKTKQTDLQINYEYAKNQGFTGSIFDYERKLKEAGRPPAAPRPEPAPSLTTIVDPTDPTKMIAIDARVYKGGGVGSPGVIGVGGKEPGAALREGKAESGKTQLADDLDNLRSSFTRLNEMRAIPSTERNVVSNLMSAAGATGVGQALGKAGGSAEQVERDVINSARQRLITSIKNATGMSARSLDSNVELKTMLNSISDPGQSYEAAMRIIDDIENAYVKGKPKAPVKPSGGGAPPPPPGFKPDK